MEELFLYDKQPSQIESNKFKKKDFKNTDKVHRKIQT
jgi:hypothetical protein